MEVRMEAWIKEGLELYKKHIGLLIIATVISVACSIFTLGLLAGPMVAGLYSVIFRLLEEREPAPQATDVFKGFDVFLPAFLFVLVFAVVNFLIHAILDFIPILGWIVSVAASVALSAVTLFVLPLVMEQRLDAKAAVEKSLEKVRPNLLPFMLFSFLVGIISSVGVIACGVGVVATIPIGLCAVAVAYRDTFESVAATPSEPVAPPPQEATGAAS